MKKEIEKKPAKKRFYRKRVRIFNLIEKIKLWPSRTGQLHGIRSIVITGDIAKLTTHCSKEFCISNSLNSRAGRWLRNKWFVKVCPKCRVPGRRWYHRARQPHHQRHSGRKRWRAAGWTDCLGIG